MHNPERLKIEKFINPAIYFLIIVGIILLLGPNSWWPSFYNAPFLGRAFLFSAAALFASMFVFHSNKPCKHETAILVRFALAVALILNSLGELYLYSLYQYGFQYDKVIHFANCFLFVLVLTSFLEAWFGFSFRKALTTSMIVVLAGGLVWELSEFSSDLLFKTNELGIYGQYKIWDTIFDIVFDILGLVAGSYFLINPKLSKRVINEYCRFKVD